MTFRPSHVVGGESLPTWAHPDRSESPGPPLEAGLDVEVLEERGSWARIACSNGWEAWVDAGGLVPREVTAAGPPAPIVPVASASAGRPAWLVPVLALGAVLVLLAVAVAFFATRADEGEGRDVAASVTFPPTTARPVVANVDVAKLVPVAEDLGSDWVVDPQMCVSADVSTTDASCRDKLADNSICGREDLVTPVPLQRGYRLAAYRRAAERLDTHVRVYGSNAEARAALDRVEAALTGPCKRFVDDPVTTIHSPMALEPVGDHHVASQRILLEEGKPETGEKLASVQVGRVLVSLRLTEHDRHSDMGPDKGFIGDVARVLAERAKAAQ